MSGPLGGLIALVGIAIVAGANLLRSRRTGDRSCIGHFFVPARDLSSLEWVMNRSGIAVFAIGIVGSFVI